MSGCIRHLNQAYFSRIPEWRPKNVRTLIERSGVEPRHTRRAAWTSPTVPRAQPGYGRDQPPAVRGEHEELLCDERGPPCRYCGLALPE
jgi:hypothetical protein